MSKATIMAIGIAFAVPVQAQQNEVIAIANGASNESVFGMLSYRYALSGDVDAGLKLRLDAAYSEFSLLGDTGSVTSLRAGGAYVFDLGSDATFTLTGMYSQRERQPENETPTGFLVSAEVYMPMASGGELFALAEYDSPEETTFTAASFLADLGGFKVGPTGNYLTEGDYTRQALGVSAAFDLTPSLEIKVTGAWAEQTIGNNAAEDASYIELQLRTTF